jgi:hypothetical protein
LLEPVKKARNCGLFFALKNTHQNSGEPATKRLSTLFNHTLTGALNKSANSLEGSIKRTSFCCEGSSD